MIDNPGTDKVQDPILFSIEVEHWLTARRRGFWWGFAALVGVLLLLFSVRVAWEVIAEARFYSLRDEYRARGLPAEPGDIRQEPVPDELNAGPIYWQAVDELPWFTDEEQDASLDMVKTHSAWLENREQVSELLNTHQAALRIVKIADQMPACDFEYRFESPMLYSQLPSLRQMRCLARLMRIAALDAHYRGDDVQGLQWCRAGLVVGERIANGYPVMIGNLVGCAIERGSMHPLETIVPTLELKPDGLQESQVRTLITKLLDFTQVQASYERTEQAMRVEAFDAAEQLMAGAIGFDIDANVPLSHEDRYVIQFYGPTVYLDAMRIMREHGRLESLRMSEPLARDTDGFAWRKAEIWWGDQYVHRLSWVISMTKQRRYLDLLWRRGCVRRLAATALAIRLYELDHGHLPKTLSELVPRYLPEVPGDLHDHTGGPIRYEPAGAWPRLWSVNLDGEDDGGVLMFDENDEQLANEADFVWFIRGGKPTRAENDQLWLETLGDDVQMEGALRKRFDHESEQQSE